MTDRDPETTDHSKSSQGLVFGLVVIAVGVFFLLRNLGVHMPFLLHHNWWAVFILVASIAPLGQAAQRYREQGRIDQDVLRHLLTAAVIIMVALFFLLDLRWDVFWPLFIIYGGCWMLLGRSRRD